MSSAIRSCCFWPSLDACFWLKAMTWGRSEASGWPWILILKSIKGAYSSAISLERARMRSERSVSAWWGIVLAACLIRKKFSSIRFSRFEHPLKEINAPFDFVLDLVSSTVILAFAIHPAIVDLFEIIFQLVLLEAGVIIGGIPKIGNFGGGQDLP